MECQHATAYIADYLAGTMSDDQLAALRAHAAACATCRDELAAAEETWTQLGEIPSQAPDVPAMRARFDALLAGDNADLGSQTSHASRAMTTQARRPFVLATAAAALLIVAVGVGVGVGIGIGRQRALPSASTSDTQMAAMKEELREMQRMMSLSLLQQQSATARLQGVIAVRQMDEPRGDVIAALLDTLTNDPNPNVRLATIDALGRFMDRDLVKRRTLEALPRQASPLVQIALIDFVVESAGLASVDALRTLSNDTTVVEAVRARAAQALRQLGAQS